MSSGSSSASLALLSRSIGREMQGSEADKAAAAKVQHETSLLHQNSILHQASLGRFGSDLVDLKWLETHNEELQLLLQESPMQSCSFPFSDPAVSQPLSLPTQDKGEGKGSPPAAPAAEGTGQDEAPKPSGTSGKRRAGSEEPIRLQLAYPPAARRQTVTTGFAEGVQPLETPPQRAAAKAAPQPRTRMGSARSAPGPMAGGSSSSMDLRPGLVPEVSLAARAGSLPNARLSNPAGRCASVSINGSEDSIGEEEEEPEVKRRGPGRKRRTAPVLVETEEGEVKHVSPSEYRRLRRRITNRLSARRMRKKHAEERAMIHHTTQELQEEKDRLRAGYEQMQRRAAELEAINQKLSAEVADWRMKWDGLMQQDPGLAQSLMLSLPRNPEQSMDMLHSFRGSSSAFQEQGLAAPLPLSLPSSPPAASPFSQGFDGAFSLPELQMSSAQDMTMPLMPSIPFPDSQLLGQGVAHRGSGPSGGNVRVYSRPCVYSGRPV